MRPTPNLAELRATAAEQAMAGSQAAFARFVGWDKGHITRLKQRGHLVLRADGLVDYAASLARIQGNADPGRDAQRERAAEKRAPAAGGGWITGTGNATSPTGVIAPLDDRQGEETPEQSDSMAYATARARKEHWQAEQARVDFEKTMGTLVERSAVAAALDDAAAVFRSALDNLAHRVAPELVGQELDTIRAILRGEVQAILGELTAAFAAKGDAS